MNKLLLILHFFFFPASDNFDMQGKFAATEGGRGTLRGTRITVFKSWVTVSSAANSPAIVPPWRNSTPGRRSSSSRLRFRPFNLYILSRTLSKT